MRLRFDAGRDSPTEARIIGVETLSFATAALRTAAEEHHFPIMRFGVPVLFAVTMVSFWRLYRGQWQLPSMAARDGATAGFLASGLLLAAYLAWELHVDHGPPPDSVGADRWHYRKWRKGAMWGSAIGIAFVLYVVFWIWRQPLLGARKWQRR